MAVWDLRATSRPWTSPANEGEEHCFMGKEEEAGRDCSEAKSAGEKAELRVMVTCHWLSCRGAHFLREL